MKIEGEKKKKWRKGSGATEELRDKVKNGGSERGYIVRVDL